MQKEPRKAEEAVFQGHSNCKGLFFYNGGGLRPKSRPCVKQTFALHLDTPSSSTQMTSSKERNNNNNRGKVFSGVGNNSEWDLHQSRTCASEGLAS